MKKQILVMAVLAVLASGVWAQEPPKDASEETPKAEKPAQAKPLSYYKLEFVLRELQDGKLLNTRNYMMVMEDSYRTSELKIGSRVPLKDERGLNYLDVGTNINCHIEGNSPSVGLNCSFEVSSFSLPEQKVTSGENSAPVLNQMRASIPAVVPEGKQTVIGIIDDPGSTRRYEIAVTATKLR